VSRGPWLTAVCASELGTLFVFSNFSALLPLLKLEWQLSDTQAGAITGFYQVGYIGAVAILATLTDYMPPRRIYLLSALWAGLTSLAFAFWAEGFVSALVLRGLVGLGLAGTYMPGMRLVAERFASGRRGFAMGCYIGTFTIGTSISLLITAWAHSYWGWRWAFAVTGMGPFAAGIIAWFVLPLGMAAVPRQAGAEAAAPAGFAPVLRNRSAVRLIAAYGGHTWELMGMRGWIVPFFTASLVARGADLVEATRAAALAGSAVLAVGALPHPFSGLLSDRLGRARPISAFMLLSAACSLGMGWALHWSWGPLVLLGLLYGILVTAESAIISTGVADHAEPLYLGRTMALQSTVGFTAGALGPVAFGLALDWAPWLGASPDGAWIWGFALLGLGALVGPFAVGFRELSRAPRRI
jgi:MFS family permease